MSDYLTLTEFIPGTKAKAQEVNANFNAIKTALSEKAAMAGDSAQKFNVADATDAANAVNKKQLDDLSDDLSLAISKTGTKFCVESGNTTNGKGDLFSYSVLQITPKIGGTYANLVISDHEGTQSTISSASSISMSGKPDGIYNIFITPTGTIYTLKNTIYKQQARPTMTDGDVWLDTSKVPLNCIKYSGTSDTKFVDVPLGAVTIVSSLITSIVTFPFDQNGYEINVNSFTQSFSGNGWAKLPNGLIVQWGENNVSANSTLDVNLPVAYPNAHLQCVASNSIDISTNFTQTGGACYPLSVSQIRLLNIEDNGAWLIRWFSIGY